MTIELVPLSIIALSALSLTFEVALPVVLSAT